MTVRIGQRIPNLAVRAMDGVQHSLYLHHHGRPQAMLLGTMDPGSLQSVSGWATAQNKQVLWLCPDVSADVPVGLRALQLVTPDWNTCCGVLGVDSGLLWLDSGFRVLDAWQPDLEAATQLTQWQSLAATRDLPAPALYVPQVLDAEECAALIHYLRDVRDGGGASGVYAFENGQPQFRLDPNIKARHEALVEDRDLEQRIHAAIAARVIPEIWRCFHFAVNRRDPLKVIRYDEGAGYFRAHRDNDSPDTSYRRFAMTLNLNTGDYRGGELSFPEFGSQRYVAAAGDALVFSCSLLHEAHDVLQGQRYALVTFFSGAR